MEFDLDFVLHSDPASLMPKNLDVVDFKVAFLTILQDKEKLAEFMEVIDLTELSGTNQCMFAFIDQYFEVWNEFLNWNRQILSHCAAFEKFMGKSYVIGTVKDMSEKEVFNLLDIFVTYLAVDAPKKVLAIPDEILATTGSKLASVFTSKLVSSDLFSDEAALVLDSIFWNCYPKYLIFKGARDELKKLESLKKKRSELGKDHEDEDDEDFEVLSPISILSDSMDTLIEKSCNNPKSGKRASLQKIFKKFSFPTFDFPASREIKVKAEPALSKEGMVDTLRNPEMCRKFNEFVEARRSSENMLCLKAFLVIESFTRASSSRREPCYHRFLSNLALDLEDAHALVEPQFVPLFLHFYLRFMNRDAEYEINIPGAVREKIAAKICTPNEIPINIFDDAIDHVLQLLYSNSYLLFMKRF